MISLIDLPLTLFFSESPGEHGRGKIIILRQLRIIKSFKLLRVLRAVRFLKDLRLMINAAINSVSTLFWCLVMISFILYIFAMMFAQNVNDLLQDHDAQSHLDPQDLDDIMEAFGSVQAAALSLFMAITGGDDWRKLYNLIRLAGRLPAMLFVFFIAFFFVAAWNIVTGTFVNKAFQTAQPDAEALMMERVHKDKEDTRQFVDLFKSADADHTGTITAAELNTLLESPLSELLTTRGIMIKDAEAFLHMLTSNGRDAVDLETFVSGCLQLKGFATSIDVLTTECRTVQLLRVITDRLRNLEICFGKYLGVGVDNMAAYNRAQGWA
jgi:hypothetical protein